MIRRWQDRNNRRVLAAIPLGKWRTATAIARSAGVRNPARIYPALNRLQTQGLVEARWVPENAPVGLRRCYYTRRAPMLSWVDGFLTDCEPGTGFAEVFEHYHQSEIVRAVRWMRDEIARLQGDQPRPGEDGTDGRTA